MTIKEASFKLILLLICMCSFSCSKLVLTNGEPVALADSKAMKRTEKLYQKLDATSKKGFLVGHQDALAYGIGWKKSELNQSPRNDIDDMVGKSPALFGFDISKIELGYHNNIDNVPFDQMKSLIIDAYKNGGVISISWHAENPVSLEDSWDQTPAVSEILNSEEIQEVFMSWISRVAGFIKSLRYKGRPIPVIFRPWHEMNGDWFWWGEAHCTPEEYIQLWQLTVNTLKDEYKLHNLIYAYSPNTLLSGDDYLKYYPGDDFVDILGLDIYDYNNSAQYAQALIRDLKVVRSLAESKGKIYALTETGLEKVTTDSWFTEYLYPSLQNSGISWVLFWRNANKKHHYVPYPGHENEQDFIDFENLPQTLFLEDLKTLKH